VAGRRPEGPDRVVAVAGPALGHVVGGRRGRAPLELVGRYAGPARPEPRRHHTISEVRQLLGTAEGNVTKNTAALERDPESPGWRRLLYSAEQGHLLVRLAADSGARRGELAVLRLGDLDGRVLTIERGLSQGVLGTTKTHRTRRLTLGKTTAALINDHFSSWAQRGPTPAADWLFSPNPQRQTYVTADALSHKFRRLGEQAGVANPALHRLRHGVATHLVDQGKLLKAQARLGHRDASTTLRHYSHCTPLDDGDVADELDDLLNHRTVDAIRAIATRTSSPTLTVKLDRLHGRVGAQGGSRVRVQTMPLDSRKPDRYFPYWFIIHLGK
jgi:integrase